MSYLQYTDYTFHIRIQNSKIMNYLETEEYWKPIFSISGAFWSGLTYKYKKDNDIIFETSAKRTYTENILAATYIMSLFPKQLFNIEEDFKISIKSSDSKLYEDTVFPELDQNNTYHTTFKKLEKIIKEEAQLDYYYYFMVFAFIMNELVKLDETIQNKTIQSFNIANVLSNEVKYLKLRDIIEYTLVSSKKHIQILGKVYRKFFPDINLQISIGGISNHLFDEKINPIEFSKIKANSTEELVIKYLEKILY